MRPLKTVFCAAALLAQDMPSAFGLMFANFTLDGDIAISRSNTAEDLVKRIGGPASGKIAPFECVVRVKVSQGVPVQAEVVALHLRH